MVRCASDLRPRKGRMTGDELAIKKDGIERTMEIARPRDTPNSI